MGRCDNNNNRNTSDKNAFDEIKCSKVLVFVTTCLTYRLRGVVATTTTAIYLIKIRLEQNSSVRKFLFCKNSPCILTVRRHGNNHNRNTSDTHAFETKKNKFQKSLFCKHLLNILTVWRCGTNNNRIKYSAHAFETKRQVFKGSCFVKTCLTY